jgi:predicted permease
MDWSARVRAAFVGRDPDDDVVEELAQHAAAAFEAARADGASEEDAARQVAALLAAWAADDVVGSRGQIHRPRRVRQPTPPPPPPAASAWAGLGGDVRYAVQVLRRQWGYALVVLLTMALGIGATTVLFSVAYGVLVRPMPWVGADRLVRLTETRQGSSRPARFLTNATYLAWSEHPTTIDGLAGWSADQFTLAGVGEPERIRVVETTPSLFPLLGGQPAIGRLFRVAASGAADEEQVVVLSHDLWLQRFNGTREAIGRMVRLDGTPYRVVAVMPPGFAFPDREVRAWIPFTVPPVAANGSGGGTLSMFSAIARLRPGITPAQAAAEATTRGRHAPDPGMVTMAVFGSRGPVQVIVVPLLDAVAGEVRPALVLFLIAVGLLLATATANVASLQLARATSRRREMAIRLALGASGTRLTRQLLVESVVVGEAGGLVGVAAAVWLVRLLPVLLPADFPRRADIAFDWRVALASVGLTLVASMAFGLAPVLKVRRFQLTESLAEDGLAPVGGAGRSRTVRTRLAIMTGQIAAATVLLLGAALLSRSFVAMLHADRGYAAENLFTAVLPLPDAAYTGTTRAALLERILARLEHTPGVRAAAVAARLPLAGGGEILGAFPVPSRGGGQTVAHASIQVVSPGYFRALGIRVVGGRTFTEADGAGAQLVLVVNRAFARQYLPAEAVGARLPGENGSREVIGIVEDVKYNGVSEASQPEIYLALGQQAAGFEFDQPAVLARTTGDPLHLSTVLRAIVRDQDASVAVEAVMTMQDRVSASLAKPRLYTVLLGGFALAAIAIAGVGLFGVLSYGVALRAREIGVRTSVGATPWHIATLVLRQALAVTAVGVALGLAVSAALERQLQALLWGISSHDGLSYGGVPVLLILVALVACWVPARRAARTDPVRVLR